jgi:heterodisulfide reductase subunit A2
LKYSAMIRKRLPETEVIHFVREWCLPGQSASELFGKAVDDSGTTFVRYMDLASFKLTSSGGKNKITFRDDGGSLSCYRPG